MKKFTVPCDFGGAKAPFDVYIGEPKKGNHPLQNQASWLSSERGGTIPAEIMESFTKLLELAEQNGVSFEELCVYALEATESVSGGEAVSSISTFNAPKATPVAPGFEKEKKEDQYQSPPPPLSSPQKSSPPPEPLAVPEVPQAESAPVPTPTSPKKPEGFKEPYQE